MDVSPARLVKSPVSELVSVSKQGPRDGTREGGLMREAHSIVVDLPSRVSATECKVSAEKMRASWASGIKREIY